MLTVRYQCYIKLVLLPIKFITTYTRPSHLLITSSTLQSYTLTQSERTVLLYNDDDFQMYITNHQEMMRWYMV